MTIKKYLKGSDFMDFLDSEQNDDDHKISNALINWVASQGISMQKFIFITMLISGHHCGMVAKDEDDMHEGLNILLTVLGVAGRAALEQKKKERK